MGNINYKPELMTVQPAFISDIGKTFKIEVINPIGYNPEYYKLTFIDPYSQELITTLISRQKENIFTVNNILASKDKPYYYKIKVAYSNDSQGQDIGPESNIGIIKSLPSSFSLGTLNIGGFPKCTYKLPSQPQDELIQFVEFELLSNDNKSIEKSNKIALKNISSTDEYSAEYSFDEYLNETSSGIDIKVKAIITTENNYIGQLGPQTKTLSPASRHNMSKFEDIVISDDQSSIIINTSGSLYRYKGWVKNNELSRWSFIKSISETDGSYIDKNIEGYGEYQYILNQNGINYISDLLKCDFEDISLFDNNKEYKIKFNPKISNFKENIQQEKTETLGSQYPFISRNKLIRYYSFSIEGLISALAEDVDNTSSRISTSSSSVSNNFIPTTNLSGANIKREREYRTELIRWLNNGRPKVFKSPTEGNYIVRLMNVLLTPNDTLGRMLYSFSAEVVEIDEYNIQNLKKYNLL